MTDSCPIMDGFDFGAVGKLMQLPKDHVTSMFVAVGRAAQSAWPHPGQLPLAEVIRYNHF